MKSRMLIGDMPEIQAFIFILGEQCVGVRGDRQVMHCSRGDFLGEHEALGRAVINADQAAIVGRDKTLAVKLGNDVIDGRALVVEFPNRCEHLVSTRIPNVKPLHDLAGRIPHEQGNIAGQKT